MRDLEVAEVCFFPNKDAVQHHTEKYEPVEGATFLRRGQLFNVGIRFKSSYDPEEHRVYLEFFTGTDVRPAGSPRFETFVQMPVLSVDDTTRQFPPPASDWGARRFENTIDNAIAIQVVSPVWLPVGKWQLSVLTRNTEPSDTVYLYPGHTYFLFNPWNEDDQTYFKDTNLLQEYILNDVSKIYKGRNMWQTWDYGQFEDCVLPAFELALEQKGKLPHHSRGDPVNVARAISKVVNSMDSKTGILKGNWSGSFINGKAPFDWDRSEDILRQFLKTQKPVRYAQCWVFAAVATTVCRALGIPARSVTNLGSGHDKDCSLTIDKFYNHDLINTKEETIWNFHCWTDVWMSRPQLSNNKEYDGWQTIDATPQEKSEDEFQLGPAPVSAVLRGHTQVSYDVPFVFTEVNGDLVRWQIRKDETLRLIDVNTNIVGQAILTNEPLSNAESEAYDITDEYKYPEHAAAERETVAEAIKNMSASGKAKEQSILIQSQKNLNDVHFGANIPFVIQFGDTLTVELTMTNTSKEERTVEKTLELVRVDYKGNHPETLFSEGPIQFVLSGNEEGAPQTISFNAEDYASQIQENQFLRLIVRCYVEETGQPWLMRDNFIEVRCPNLRIKIDEELQKDTETTVTFSLDKPFEFPLTDCRLVVKGSALAGGDVIALDLEDTPQFETFTARVAIRPQRAGSQKICAKLISAQLPKAEGWIEVYVQESTDGMTNDIDDLTLRYASEYSSVTEMFSNGDNLTYADKLWKDLMR